MESYQREVVALIKTSRARVAILRDHLLIELWRKYSADSYHVAWISPSPSELARFIRWSNSVGGISHHIQDAEKEESRVTGTKKRRPRRKQ